MAAEIFISYRRADEAWARLLYTQIKSEGAEAWYDSLVGVGEDWRVATAKALEASRIFVLLFSENAAQSSDIAKELAAAVLENKLIIPVRLQNIAPKGAFLYELASRNWINAYDNTEVKLSVLAKGLARLVQTGALDDDLLPFERAEVGKGAKWNWQFKAAACALAALSMAIWLLWPERKWMVESSRPFISTLALEGDPAFSPDGKILAYTSGSNSITHKLFMRNLAGGASIQISNDSFDDVSPSWSPDGTRIAYVAREVGERCRIMVAAIPSGEARVVGRCATEQSTSVCWQPGTSFLYYFERVASGSLISRLDLDSGALVNVMIMKGKVVTYLQCSPDGRFLLYLWGITAGTHAVTVIDLISGSSRNVAVIPNNGSATWSQDSRAVFASITSGIGSDIIAYPVNGDSSYRIYTTPITVSRLAAGIGGGLALETDASRQNLAKASPTPIGQPDIIDPANGRSWAPTFAPDGKLAFLSNRSGTNAIWVMNQNGSPEMLYDAGRADMFRLEFSPDGKKLAAAIAKPDGITIKILTAEGGTVTTFDSPTLGYSNPTWMPDGKSVIVWDRPTLKLRRVIIDKPELRIPIADAPPWQAVAVRNGAVFAVKFVGGIWRTDHGEKLINSKYPRDFEPPITFRGEDILIPDFKAPEGPRILAQPVVGGSDKVLAYSPGAEAEVGGLFSKMAVNPKTAEIIYVASVQGDTNIDLLTLAKH